MRLEASWCSHRIELATSPFRSQGTRRLVSPVFSAKGQTHGAAARPAALGRREASGDIRWVSGVMWNDVMDPGFADRGLVRSTAIARDHDRDSAVATFAELAPQLVKGTKYSDVDGLLRHPSGVVLAWDYQQLSLFCGRITEIVCVDGVRLWLPVEKPNDNELPFVWMIKGNRMFVETIPTQESTNFILVLDVNEMLDEEIRLDAERRCLEAVNSIRSQGVRAWVAECSGR
jgi:hypothetical protein